MNEGAPKPKTSVPEVKQTKSPEEQKVKHPLRELGELIGSSEEDIVDSIRRAEQKTGDDK